MNIAVIDIGTNTVLMTIYDTNKKQTISDHSTIVRLGEGVSESKIITQAAIVRLINTLTDYQNAATLNNVRKFFLIATSAMRDAKNQKQVINYVFAATGLTIDVISGDDEAELTYFGGIDGIKIPTSSIGLLDIGGGSTEYIIGNSEKVVSKKSLNIGTVRLSEKFNLLGEDPKQYKINDFKQLVTEQLKTLPMVIQEKTTWVAVAGTPTSLSSIILNLTTYDANRVHGSKVTVAQLNKLCDEFSKIPPSEILKRYPILNKRHDVILAGCLILLGSFEYFRIEEIIVSDRGLRYGKIKSILTKN